MDPHNARSAMLVGDDGKNGWRFFATLALYLEIVPSEAVGTAATDGEKLWYNPGWFEGLTKEEAVGVIAHETLHAALGHVWRRGARERVLWNVACDLVVNHVVRKAGMRLPEGALGDSSVGDSSYAEEVYERIRKDNRSPQAWGAGDVISRPRREDAGSMEEAWRRRLSAAASYGSTPAFLKVLVKAASKPLMPWRDLLSEFLSRALSGFSWMPPDRRFAHAGIYLPTFETEALGEIVLALDTSGSVPKSHLSQFLAEVWAVAALGAAKVHVCLADAAVHRWYERSAGDPLPEVEVVGRGGTDFRPAFEEVKKRGVVPAAFVYLTDGCGTYPARPPAYPVLWVLTTDAEPPFGSRARMFC